MKKRKKNRPGPKPMSEDRRRRYRMQIPLNLSERQDVELAAAREGLPVAVWVRRQLTESIIKSQNLV